MRSTATILAIALAASLAPAGDIPIEVEGRTVTVRSTALNRQITEKDREAGGQDAPLACSFLYYGHLSKADIQNAAALSTDPKATADKWTQYQERVGAEAFKEAMAAYFTATNVVAAELTVGDAAMLVVKTDEYTAGQIYVCRGGRWLVAEHLKTAAGAAFGKILSMIQDGEITF